MSEKPLLFYHKACFADISQVVLYKCWIHACCLCRGKLHVHPHSKRQLREVVIGRTGSASWLPLTIPLPRWLVVYRDSPHQHTGIVCWPRCVLTTCPGAGNIFTISTHCGLVMLAVRSGCKVTDQTGLLSRFFQSVEQTAATEPNRETFKRSGDVLSAKSSRMRYAV